LQYFSYGNYAKRHTAAAFRAYVLNITRRNGREGNVNRDDRQDDTRDELRTRWVHAQGTRGTSEQLDDDFSRKEKIYITNERPPNRLSGFLRGDRVGDRITRRARFMYIYRIVFSSSSSSWKSAAASVFTVFRYRQTSPSKTIGFSAGDGRTPSLVFLIYICTYAYTRRRI